MKSTMRVAILVSNYFEQAEFTEPLDRLKDAGVDVTVVSSETIDMQALQHADHGDTFTADVLLKDAEADDYDALLLPGGAINADQLRVVPKAQTWVQDFLESGRPVAVICHAPWLLVSAGVVGDRQLTSYHTIQDDIRNAGGDWVDREVVVDDNLITSRKPDDLPAFIETFLDALQAHNEEERFATVTETTTDDTESVPSPAALEREARLRSLGYDKKRDQLSTHDQLDILADEDATDPDELHLSGTVPRDQQDHTQ